MFDQQCLIVWPGPKDTEAFSQILCTSFLLELNSLLSLSLRKILNTVKQAQGVTNEAGIKMELEEIEARNETYPQTRAFLKLINRLTDITLPSALGAGYRVPGFAPYLEFIKDDVFLKFKGRAYQDASEKVSFSSTCRLLIVSNFPEPCLLP